MLAEASWGYEPRRALLSLLLNVAGTLDGFRLGGWGHGDVERCKGFKWDGVEVGSSERHEALKVLKSGR